MYENYFQTLSNQAYKSCHSPNKILAWNRHAKTQRYLSFSAKST